MKKRLALLGALAVTVALYLYGRRAANATEITLDEVERESTATESTT